MKNPKIIGYVAAIISTILMGSMGIFVRNLSVNGSTITFARLGLGLLFLLVYLFFRGEIGTIKKTTFSFHLLITGILISSTVLCYIHAINSTSLANAVFLLYLGPMIAVGLAAMFMKEKFTVRNGVLLCMAFIGFLFLLEFNFTLRFQELKGYLWGVCSALSYALYIVFNRKIPSNVPALTRSFYQFFFGAIVMLPLLHPSVLLHLTTREVLWLLAVGLFQGFLALSLLIFAVKQLKTVEYGTVSYLEPLVASLIGIVLYSENLTSLQLIGYAIVFSGGIIQILSTKNHSRQVDAI